VRRRPYAVVLFDEVEKAHPEVLNVLLQLLDDGRLTDGKGRVVDFTNTIIISTSNIGAEAIQRNLQAAERDRKSYGALKDELMVLLRKYLRPEFLNRIDEIIIFHALSRGQTRDIIVLQLTRVKRLSKGQGLTLEFDPSLIDHFAEVGYEPQYGARELRRRIRSELETVLAGAMLRGDIGEGDTLRFRYDKDGAAVRWEKVPLPEVRAREDEARPARGREREGPRAAH